MTLLPFGRLVLSCGLFELGPVSDERKKKTSKKNMQTNAQSVERTGEKSIIFPVPAIQ